MSVRTPSIKERHGKIIQDSIAEIRKIRIGGIDQYIMIRGNNVKNPIILFAHGGPGQAEIGYVRELQKELEEKFVVVRWDQRGSGLSASKDIPKQSLNINTLVSDINEITDYLIKMFNQPKIFISGHSWGTIIAANSVKNTPEKYYAYIGVGQFVDVAEGEKISYNYTMAEARRQNNLKVINKLEKIGHPPYTAEKLLIRAQCLSMLGCVFKTKPNINMGKALMLSSEYTLLTKLSYSNFALK